MMELFHDDVMLGCIRYLVTAVFGRAHELRHDGLTLCVTNNHKNKREMHAIKILLLLMPLMFLLLLLLLLLLCLCYCG